MGVTAAVVLVVGLLVFAGWYLLFREEPQRFSSPEQQFLHGSIGNEASEGMPYLIWRVLPQLFPEYLPQGRGGGYDAFGILYEPGNEIPVGFSKKTVGFERINFNCAVCHTGSYRTDPQGQVIIVPTAPTTRLDIEAYARFLFAAAADPRFTQDNVLAAIKAQAQLNPVEEALYRYLIIPQTKAGVNRVEQRQAWTNTRPLWGPGRIDPFNPVKFFQLELDSGTDTTIGNSDMEPLWDMDKQSGYALHWDGLNDSLTEVALTGALGDGATPESLPVADINALAEWVKTVRPPRYPYPIDAELAARGEPTYRALCAGCHAFGGARTGTVVPQAEVGTDTHRLEMWSEEASRRYNAYAAEYPWRFTRFVKMDGFVSVPLDGVWLRAPYLHNGSVPSMEDLLEPTANRPRLFYRGYDVYDRARMGFVSDGPEAQAAGSRYDVSVPGNGNAGHEGEVYGTALSADQKRALVEYLKTL